MTSLFIGIDLGTSGCRAVAIDAQQKLQAQAEVEIPQPQRDGHQVEQDPLLWWQATQTVLAQLAIDPKHVKAIAVDATSATMVLTDAQAQPLYPGLLYNDSRAIAQAQQIQMVAPKHSAACGPTATLAKLLWAHQQQLTQQAHYLMHQADWIMAQLGAPYGVSDVNNCLKLGYDVVEHCWPQWLNQLDLPLELLPQKVVTPGTRIGILKAELAQQFGFPLTTQLVAGTTDSTAAFIATGARNVGEAVTSLGSTLVLKVIADQAIVDACYGVYSQPLGSQWLVGGASNSGGQVLLNYFTPAQLEAMTPLLTPAQPTHLNYYPLLEPGERFPFSDPQLAPRLTPRPQNDVVFFQGILEGIAAIERQGYQLLHQLGAPYPSRIYTTGGGAHNPAWRQVRAAILGVPVSADQPKPAAYGSALLAWQACN